MIPTDEALMQACKAGDAGAFSTLVRRHRTPVFRFLLRLIRNEALAEEALGETFLHLFRAAPAYEPRAPFSTFLFTIAYRQAIDLLRHQALEAGVMSLSPAEGAGSATPPEPPCRLPGPAHRLETLQTLTAVDRALERLPELQRAAFLLFYREELPSSQIALALNIPDGSVRFHLSAARKTLRELLVEEERQLEPRTGSRRQAP